MNNKIKNTDTPAMPTMPIQDKLGQIIMATGLSKLEYAAINIASSMSANLDEAVLPETIAQVAIERAKAIFDELEIKDKESTPIENSLTLKP